MAATRPTVTVYDSSAEGHKAFGTSTLPLVFSAPIRPDVVTFIHTQMAKNKRQAYAVNRGSGMQHSAESWGTGRAVSRVPRIQGSGMSKAGSAAFVNQARGGRMFAPTKIWRRWHKRTPQQQKRYAVASAIAATGVVPLVQARGHRVSETPECPLVLGGEIESVLKTKDAVRVLERCGAMPDVDRSKHSRALRAGKGKMRNRRYTARLGPLVVYKEDNGIVKAFRNIPGVDLCPVDSLNLLQLAPGGHMGRFVIWTQSAFDSLDAVYAAKKNFSVPKAIMTNTSLARLINSDEIQKVVRPTRAPSTFAKKRNPFKNVDEMIKLNPYAAAFKEAERKAHAAATAAKKRKRTSGTTKAQKKAFYKGMIEQ